jgi:transposase
MLCSIYCMHWIWRNCPTVLKGQFTGRGKYPTMILDAVATHDLWILADGIYPEWQAFVKTVRNPIDRKKSLFARAQESTRKDIERAFGVLQARWAVIRGPAYGWDRDQLSNIMTTCIILHNTIIEDGKELAHDQSFDRLGDLADPSTRSNKVRGNFVQRLHNLKNKSKHQELQNDLIEHQWMRYVTA